MDYEKSHDKNSTFWQYFCKKMIEKRKNLRKQFLDNLINEPISQKALSCKRPNQMQIYGIEGGFENDQIIQP